MLALKTPDKLVDNFKASRKELDDWLAKELPKDKQLRYATGKYVGRMCRVKEAFWEAGSRRTLDVWVLVETSRADGKGFMASHDPYHRMYKPIGCFKAL